MSDEGYKNDFEGGTFTLDLDDGSSVECDIVAVFPIGDKDYIALLPTTGKDANNEVYLYGYKESEDGEPSLIYIDDEDEYEAVVDAFDELMDEDEFEDLDADGEED